jgi:hypothetical protein
MFNTISLASPKYGINLNIYAQYIVQWNLFKQNYLGSNFFVQNKQVFSLYRLN